MYVCTSYVNSAHTGQKRPMEHPRNGATYNGAVISCGCWKLNSRSLQE